MSGFGGGVGLEEEGVNAGVFETFTGSSPKRSICLAGFVGGAEAGPRGGARSVAELSTLGGTCTASAG